jgi:hypothetical protein
MNFMGGSLSSDVSVSLSFSKCRSPFVHCSFIDSEGIGFDSGATSLKKESSLHRMGTMAQPSLEEVKSYIPLSAGV